MDDFELSTPSILLHSSLCEPMPNGGSGASWGCPPDPPPPSQHAPIPNHPRRRFGLFDCISGPCPSVGQAHHNASDVVVLINSATLGPRIGTDHQTNSDGICNRFTIEVLLEM